MINKISNRFRKNKYLPAFFFQLLSFAALGQGKGFVRPDVTASFSTYKMQVAADADKKMIELKTLIPGLMYDLRYATFNNFMRRAMYPQKTKITFLRVKAANALLAVQKALNEKGLGLKIFDAYRPYKVTVKFWKLIKDERFVANPAKGSGHNRGTTVDLTLIKLHTNEELDMGTGFDNFSDTAHHGFTGLKKEVLENRLLLKTTMEQFGFKPYNDEWWHYSFHNGKQYEILDLSFKKLMREL
jgi:D-alanyl-D-alanine dipeptidase